MPEDIKERLLELLKLYDGNLADETFIRSAISIMVTGFNLDNYVTKVTYIPRKEHMDPKYAEYTAGFSGMFGQAGYIPKNRELVIYERNLFYSKEMAARSSDIDEEKIAFINLLVLQTIFHELEHAHQERLVQEGKTLEAEFLRVLAEEKKGETTESYEVCPTERGAELKSWDEIIELAEAMHLASSKIYELFNKARSDEMARGYSYSFEDDVLESCPLKRYADLRGINFDKLARIIDSFDDTLYDIYGCPLELSMLEAKTGKKVDFRR